MRRADKLNTFMCLQSWYLSVSTFWNTQCLPKPGHGWLYLIKRTNNTPETSVLRVPSKKSLQTRQEIRNLQLKFTLHFIIQEQKFIIYNVPRILTICVQHKTDFNDLVKKQMLQKEEIKNISNKKQKTIIKSIITGVGNRKVILIMHY